MNDDFDIVLILDPTLEMNEAVEHDQYGMFAFVHPNSQYNIGQKIASSLRNSDGYGVEVVDYGSDCNVRVTYADSYTGRAVTLNALIKFASSRGDGVVKLSSNKWRTISSWDQAVQYIRTKMSNIRSAASNTSQ